ncbi:MAG: porin [Herbaspirillum sp.]|jgi:predicted porin|nr:porin [Herbaspirillum sp.]
MKKTLCALGLLAGMTNGAFAQTSVTIYGLIDEAFVFEGGGAAGSVTKLTSGVAAGSRIGFKGNEDLGGGLSALFLLENGFQADTGAAGQGGLLFGRQAYVGLSGGMGTITLGRQYTPQYLTTSFVDPFNNGSAGDSVNILQATGAGASRMDNTVKYAMPVVNGFSGELAYGFGEVAGSTTTGRQLGGMIGYAPGPLDVRVATHVRNNDTATTKMATARNTLFAATYNFNILKLHLGYEINKGPFSAALRNTSNPYNYAVAPTAASVTTDSADVLVGVTVPFGPHTLLASYIHKNDKMSANQDATQTAIGYRYALSKRTDLYAVYAYIHNKNGASYTVGSAIETGSGNRALNLGIRHTF